MFSRQKPAVEDSFVAVDNRPQMPSMSEPSLPQKPVMAASAPSAQRGLSASMPSLLSADLKVTGSIMTDGEVELNGEVEGTVYAKRVTVGSTADMKGDIVAEHAIIDGPMKGRVTARIVHLRKHARFDGDLIHQKIIIDEGAEFEGSVHRKVDEAAWTDITRTFDEPGVELTDDASRAVEALKREFMKA